MLDEAMEKGESSEKRVIRALSAFAGHAAARRRRGKRVIPSAARRLFRKDSIRGLTDRLPT
jgi:hypothetical protein